MDLSIVIPVYNEEESLIPLMKWINDVMTSESFDYQVVFIDDGSTDKSWKIIQDLDKTYVGHISGVKFRRNYGKAAALSEGFKVAEGEIICTMDADLQDSPDELPEMVRMIREDNYDVVSGWKQKRHDPISKTVPSKLFNWVAREVSNIHLHDFNCGLKAYRKEAAKDISVHGDMHRWMPVLAKWEGYDNIGEKVVEHRARQYGVSKFGARRLISGFLDLLTLFFVGKFNKKPMHFFGTLGLISLLIGVISLIYLSISKLFFDQTGIAERPLFYFGILTIIVGSQLFLTGFLAELITDNRSKTYRYNIEATI